MLAIYKADIKLGRYAGPRHWNDPDMPEVGNDTEYRTHFTLWAMLSAPLLIGSDIRKASSATLAILRNSDVIALDQDVKGVRGNEISSTDGLHVIRKPSANGDTAVALFNETGRTATISTTLSAVGVSSGEHTQTDLRSKAKSTTSGAISASVPAHGTVVYRVR